MNRSYSAVIITLALVIIIYLRYGSLKNAFRYVTRGLDGKIPIRGGDGRYYYVLSDKPEPKEASKKVEDVNAFIIEFITKLKRKYLYNEKTCFSESTFTPDDEFIPFEKNCSENMDLLSDFKYRAVYLLVTRYRPGRLEENQPTSSRDTSWEEGKGERIALCLREQNTGKYGFIDPELVKFVAIHELTHIAANRLDHPFYFWKVFKFLLLEAKDLMQYQLVDYSLSPVNYCGMIVTYNPVYDDTLDITRNDPQDVTEL